MRGNGLQQVLVAITSALVGVITGLSCLTYGVSAHPIGWRVRTPEMIGVTAAASNPIQGWILSEAVASYHHGTNLSMYKSYKSGSTNIEVYGGVLVPGRVGFPRTYEAIAGPQGYLECEPLLNGCDGDFKVDVAKIFVDATNSEWQEMHRFARYQRQVITHELGHAVGLAHVEHPECNWVDTVMGHYRCFDKSAFFFTLQSHDVGDINNMYP